MNQSSEITSEPGLQSNGRAVRRTRAGQLEANRASLIKAAVKVVGKEGYSKASVGKITAVARLGQGTFYTYFSSRQELFDTLLPEVGDELLQHVRERVAGSKTLVEVEEGSYRAFADYVIANPWYARILFEAETMAPTASRTNAHRVHTQHVARLKLAWERGELPDYKRDQVPALSAILLGLRRQFASLRIETHKPPVPAQALIEVSVKVIRRALLPGPGPEASGPR